MNQIPITDRITTITNDRIFDGERVLNKQTVTIKGEKIINVGGQAPVDEVSVFINFLAMTNLNIQKDIYD